MLVHRIGHVVYDDERRTPLTKDSLSVVLYEPMREVCGIGIKHLHLLDPMLVERHPSILRGRRLAEGPEPEPAEPLPALPAQRPPIQQLAPALLLLLLLFFTAAHPKKHRRGRKRPDRHDHEVDGVTVDGSLLLLAPVGGHDDGERAEDTNTPTYGSSGFATSMKPLR